LSGILKCEGNSKNDNGTLDKRQRKTRVATYARVSTTEQATEGTSMEFQDGQLTGYCKLQNWTIIKLTLIRGSAERWQPTGAGTPTVRCKNRAV